MTEPPRQLNLSENRGLRLLTLCAMYVSQGLPFGFVTYTLAAYLAEHGMTVAQIGKVTAMGVLPWSFKWVWGPVIDTYGLPSMGRRRPWILLAQSLMAITLGSMILIPDVTENVRLLCAMVFIHNCFGALQDVSVDALAVDLLKENERGIANGLMYGSSYGGSALGGAGIGLVVSHLGLRVGLIVQVGILLTIMLIPLLLRERAGERLLPWSPGRCMLPKDKRAGQSVLAVLRSLLRAFSLRAPILTGVVAFLCYLGSGVLSVAAVAYFVQKLGWSQEDYSSIAGGYGVAAGLFGAAAGGFLADRLGPRRMIAIASVLLGLTWIGFCFAEPFWEYKYRFLLPFTIVETLFVSVLSVSFFALAMGVSWPKVAATQFTAYMALLNLSTVAGKGLAAWLDKVLDFGWIYFTMGVVQILVVVPLYFVDPRQTRSVLGDASEPPDKPVED